MTSGIVPGCPPSSCPGNCTRFVLAQVRGSNATVVQRAFADAAVFPPLCPSRSAASPRVSVEPSPSFLHPDVSRLRHFRLGVVRCLLADQLPDSPCGLSIFICFLNLHADRPCRDFRGASDGSPATPSTPRSGNLIRDGPDLCPVDLCTDGREVGSGAPLASPGKLSVYTVDGTVNSSSAFPWRKAADSVSPLS
jgi:hypothetical protein